MHVPANLFVRLFSFDTLSWQVSSVSLIRAGLSFEFIQGNGWVNFYYVGLISQKLLNHFALFLPHGHVDLWVSVVLQLFTSVGSAISLLHVKGLACFDGLNTAKVSSIHYNCYFAAMSVFLYSATLFIPSLSRFRFSIRLAPLHVTGSRFFRATSLCRVDCLANMVSRACYVA